MKWYTAANQMAAELEKYMAYPYTINVVEEMARNKMIAMVHEKREEDRKKLFEATVQVSFFFFSPLTLSRALPPPAAVVVSARFVECRCGVLRAFVFCFLEMAMTNPF